MLDKPDERRRYFRLRYESGERPELITRLGSWPIAEISQSGARLIGCEAFPPGFSFVTVRLPDGHRLETTARFFRIEGSEVVVAFDPLLPTTFIFQEQCRLAAGLPGLEGFQPRA